MVPPWAPPSRLLVERTLATRSRAKPGYAKPTHLCSRPDSFARPLAFLALRRSLGAGTCGLRTVCLQLGQIRHFAFADLLHDTLHLLACEQELIDLLHR